VVCLRTAAWIGLVDTQDLTGLPLDREVLVWESAAFAAWGKWTTESERAANHEFNICLTICI
jgi:hypothetical protein